jgi:HD-like signal output (HDOD) protein
MVTAPPFPGHALPTADEVVRQLTHFPSAPRVLPRLKRLLSDANSSMHEIVTFIRLDPGIAARVLQMGNSAYYGNGNQCYTVDEAVNRVGYNQIYELVSYAVASQVLIRPLAAYRIEADDLWKMSVACALSAEYLAALTGEDQSIAYTVGLLHGVGMVAIEEWLTKHPPVDRFESRGLPREAMEAERARLGFHQGEAGAALLRLWEFPAVMTEPVRCQYAPRLTSAHQRTACLLHAAKWMRTAICSPGPLPARPEPVILQTVRLTAGQLESGLATVQDRLAAVSSLLQSDAGETSDLKFPGGVRTVADGPDSPRRAVVA